MNFPLFSLGREDKVLNVHTLINAFNVLREEAMFLGGDPPVAPQNNHHRKQVKNYQVCIKILDLNKIYSPIVNNLTEKLAIM